VSVDRVTPRLVSITVTGDALHGFELTQPTSHIKLFLAPDGGELVLPTQGPDGPVFPDDAMRPVIRTYTPRRYDATTNTLEIQFALHGEGPAAQWAGRAAAGDKLAVAGPGGRFQLDTAAERWWIAGDESALPAIAGLLESLPITARAEVHLEVADATDELPLPAASVTWHHRRAGAYGAELLAAATALTVSPGTSYWVACEAAAVRRIRRQLLDAGVPRQSLTTRGYWRLGEANHPDHDYGED